ncbi:MAG: hypothetical protein VXW65_04140 [Pseudomonadota bacterium]|nr:hypothetical protein [Pseudomonadota bacterium]
MNRHIGGLENRDAAFADDIKVNRHIGGLENVAYPTTQSIRVIRHIGGLKKPHFSAGLPSHGQLVIRFAMNFPVA